MSDTAHRFSPAQVTYLDFVRFLAAEIVLIGHASHLFLPLPVFRGGALECVGVVLFFLLSGLLITHSTQAHLRRPGYQPVHFLAARFGRIYTAYLPALVCVAVADRLLAASPAYPYAATDGPLSFLGNLFMLQEFPLFQILRRAGFGERPWYIEAYGTARPFWSVAVEWWIYLLFGFVAFALARGWRMTPARWLLVAVLAVVPAYHVLGGVGECLGLVWIVGMGVALALPTLRRALGTPARGIAVAAISAALLLGRAASGRFDPYQFQCDLFIAGILFGLFLALSRAGAARFGALHAAVRFGAGFSYSLYLIHYTVIIAVALFRGGDPAFDPTVFAVAIVLSNLSAIVFWFVFERHYHRVTRALTSRIDRHFPSASRESASQAHTAVP